jgi:hypothetical protein
MRQICYIILICFCFFSSCKEDEKPVVQRSLKIDKIQPLIKTEELDMTLKSKDQHKVIQCVFPPSPCPFDPEPIDPPGYIPEPINLELPPSPPKTLRDSIVNFPATMVTFGSNLNDFNMYVDSKIAATAEFQYLKEIGAEGKIYVRLIIDVNGKVRELDFLKFTSKETEILKGLLQKSLLAMPNWSPAKNEQGQAVVSEYTLPIRVSFQ